MKKKAGLGFFDTKPTYSDWRMIGSFSKLQVWVDDSMDESLWMTVAHEVAHHIQRAHCPRIKRFAKNHRKPHGDCFKTIYRYLRKDFINPMLDA